MEGARWAQWVSGTVACSRVESVCGTLGSDLLQGSVWCVRCCRSWSGCIESPQLLIHIAPSPDVLCCFFVYLDVLLRSHAFSPKRLELVLKVVVWCFFSTTRSLFFPCICVLLSREFLGAVGSQRKLLLLMQQTAAVHHCSAPICTQNKLQILRVKPGISRG